MGINRKRLLLFVLASVFTFLLVTVGVNLEASNAGEGVQLADIETHWAKNYIESLIVLGVVNGYPDNTFKPNNSITRGEFVKLVVLAELTDTFNASSQINTNDLPKTANPSFPDTGNHWVHKQGFLEQAVQWGFVRPQEYPGGFEPDKQITRLEMAIMIVRALNKEADALAQSGTQMEFKDAGDIPPEWVGYIQIANQKGIINGYPDNTFLPGRGATRAEASKMINQRLNYPTMTCFVHH